MSKTRANVVRLVIEIHLRETAKTPQIKFGRNARRFPKFEEKRAPGRPIESTPKELVSLLRGKSAKYTDFMSLAIRAGISQSTFKRLLAKALFAGLVSKRDHNYFPASLTTRRKKGVQNAGLRPSILEPPSYPTAAIPEGRL